MKARQYSLVVGLVISVALAAKAVVIIDTFDVGGVISTAVGPAPSNGPTVTNGTAAPSDIIGGYHTITGRLASASIPNNSSRIAVASIDAANTDVLRIDGNSKSWAQATVLWNANGAGLGSADVTVGGMDQFTLALGTSMSYFRYTLAVLDSDSSSIVSQDRLVLSPGDETLNFLFSSFTGIDFTDLSSIQLTALSLSPDSDVDISILSTTNSVPEPASAGLLALCGVLGLLHRRRRS